MYFIVNRSVDVADVAYVFLLIMHRNQDPTDQQWAQYVKQKDERGGNSTNSRTEGYETGTTSTSWTTKLHETADSTADFGEETWEDEKRANQKRGEQRHKIPAFLTEINFMIKTRDQ